LSDWLKLLEYLNSDWEEDLELRRFTSEYIFKMTNESVFWSSKHQKTVILFFCEVKYMTLMKATKKVMWMQKLLKELKLKRFKTVTIQIDNQKAIVLTKNSEFHVCTKHIDIYHHFIREVEFCRLIYLDYILTNNMAINRLTKSLLTLKFIHFTNFMSLISQWKALWSNDMTLEFKTQETSVQIESEAWHIFLNFISKESVPSFSISLLLKWAEKVCQTFSLVFLP